MHLRRSSPGIVAWVVAACALSCRRDHLATTLPPRHVSFPTSDGGLIHADEYGKGERSVVLAHGGRFNKESWEKPAQELAQAGFRVLALDFRGYGESRGGPDSKDPYAELHLDVLASMRYLRETGARRVSLVGGSMGGSAAAEAATLPEAGEIESLVLIAASPIEHPESMRGRKLFILSRDDLNGDGSPRLPRIREQYERAPEPKEWVVLEGSAHAQYLFDTDQGPRLMQEILRFLSAP